MTETQTLARKLQLKPGNRLWAWPETDALHALGDEHTRSEAVDADVALVFAEDRQQVDEALQEYADDLAAVRAVWIVYAKGNKTDMNRDTLWVQLAEYGWKAVSQVSYSEALSALRVRPLKEGESAPA